MARSSKVHVACNGHKDCKVNALYSCDRCKVKLCLRCWRRHWNYYGKGVPLCLYTTHPPDPDGIEPWLAHEYSSLDREYIFTIYRAGHPLKMWTCINVRRFDADKSSYQEVRNIDLRDTRCDTPAGIVADMLEERGFPAFAAALRDSFQADPI